MNRTVAAVFPAAALSLGLGLVMAPPSAAQDAHAGHRPVAPSLNQGQLWPTDAPLRQGMSAIRDALEGPAQGDADLAGAIEAQLEYIVANCRLPEDADAQLHLVLARLYEATDRLRAGDGVAGRAEAAEALGAYAAAFDHPGWTAPSA